jgi:hypothetical protein
MINNSNRARTPAGHRKIPLRTCFANATRVDWGLRVQVSRRRLIARGSVAGGVALATAAAAGLLGPDRLPLGGGYAPAGNPIEWSRRGGAVKGWCGDGGHRGMGSRSRSRCEKIDS